MLNEIYKLPITSSWIASPEFYKRIGRICEILCEYEKDDELESIQLRLIFKKCWAVKFTYYVANDPELIPLTYDKVVDFGKSDWLNNVDSNIASNGIEIGQLKHLGIFFDDGPLYEFICEEFEVQENSK